MLLLAYASQAAFDFGDGDLITLLMDSRANNQRDGVTGLLLHDAGRFVQVLEGDDEIIRRKYGRIAADPRHRHVTTVLEENTTQRQFPKWTMGYKTLNDPLVASIPGFDRFFTRGSIDTTTPARALLQGFRLGEPLSATVSTA